jgi:sortase (surface protein transpeptidase)
MAGNVKGQVTFPLLVRLNLYTDMNTFIPVSSFEAPPAPFFELSLPVQPPLASKRQKHLLPKIFALIGITILLISWGPSLFFRLTNEANRYKVSASNIPVSSSNYQPVFDRSLPLENSVKINSIQVDGLLYEASNEDHETALAQGIWRVSNYGTPYDRSLPTILVAHRFGYLSWSNLFRRHNSFYNLPKLAVGDTVEIVWRQRKYVYAVYAESQGTEIADYQADLILYTCEDLSSNVKIIKYAKLIEL